MPALAKPPAIMEAKGYNLFVKEVRKERGREGGREGGGREGGRKGWGRKRERESV